MMLLAIVFAVLGAACSAIGAQLQHDGVRAETQESGLTLRKLGRLVRNPLWLRGFVVLFACAVLQILALAFAPVTVVAPIVVLALPMVALLNMRELDVAGWIAVAATTASIALFVSSTVGAVAEQQEVAPRAVFSAGQYVGAAVLVLCIAGFASRGIARCIALAMAAGSAYGLVTVLVRDVTFSVRTDGFADVPFVSLAGLVVAFLAGSWLIQLGYASGPPDVVVGSQTVLNPLVATAIGFFLLGEAGAVGAGLLATLVVSASIAVAGVAVLARHHPDAIARRRERRDARAGRVPGRLS